MELLFLNLTLPAMFFVKVSLPSMLFLKVSVSKMALTSFIVDCRGSFRPAWKVGDRGNPHQDVTVVKTGLAVSSFRKSESITRFASHQRVRKPHFSCSPALFL